MGVPRNGLANRVRGSQEERVLDERTFSANALSSSASTVEPFGATQYLLTPCKSTQYINTHVKTKAGGTEGERKATRFWETHVQWFYPIMLWLDSELSAISTCDRIRMRCVVCVSDNPNTNSFSTSDLWESPLRIDHDAIGGPILPTCFLYFSHN